MINSSSGYSFPKSSKKPSITIIFFILVSIDQPTIFLVNKSIKTNFPFREGNGRTQREVIRVLALAKGYELLINVDGQDEVYKQYMDGTVYSDVKLLEQLISSLMEKIVE